MANIYFRYFLIKQHIMRNLVLNFRAFTLKFLIFFFKSTLTPCLVVRKNQVTGNPIYLYRPHVKYIVNLGFFLRFHVSIYVDMRSLTC